MTETDVDILQKQDGATLAKWWCLLNSWKWPAELPDAEPAHRKTPADRRGRIMSYIDAKIGHKACMREWNRETMNDQEFEDFWNRGTDPAAAQRYADYSKRRIEQMKGAVQA